MVASYLRRLDDNPRGTGVLLSYGRIALGVAFLLAPRKLWTPQLKEPADIESTLVPLRMAAVRDLVMGLGVILANRRGAPLRGWLEAAVLADATDAVLFSTNKALRPAPKLISASVAGSAAYLGRRAASRLTSE